MLIRGNNRNTLANLAAGFLVTISVFTTAAHAQSSVTLGWDASTDPALAGYRLYQGVVSHTYTSSTNVSTATTATVTGLMPGRTYFFAVTAYDTAGLESSYSGEVSYTVPVPAPKGPRLQMAVNAAKQVTLSGTAPAGYMYAVLATKDFKTWTTNGSVLVSTNGTFQFIDPTAATNSMRFYRLRQISTSSVALLQSAVNSSRQVVLTGLAPAGYSYVVLATKDFKTWTTNGSVTVGSLGTFSFTDPAKATNAMRFYKLRRT